MQLSSTDLRIGNWVQHEPHEDEIWQVDLKLLDFIECQSVYVVGLPITPDILIGAGFEVKDMADLGMLIQFKISNEISVYYHEESIWVGQHDTTCTYVHQLQNLYHALTGQELTIKL